MFRCLTYCVTGGLLIAGLVGCFAKGESPDPKPREQPGGSRQIGEKLFAQADRLAAVADPDAPLTAKLGAPIVIPQCSVNFTLENKVDLPSQRDAVVSYFATELTSEDMVPPEKILMLEFQIDDKKITKRFKSLQEGDVVKKGQLVAQLDDRLPRSEVVSKKAKVRAAEADFKAAIELKNEARARLNRQEYLYKINGTSKEELGLANATWEKQKAEEISKGEGIKVAQAEQSQAETVLEYYQLRSPISGKIKTFYKRPREAVKAFEPVLQIYADDPVRVEGLLEQKYIERIRRSLKGKGVRVVIEVAPDEAPLDTLSGHLQEVTGVAVSKDSKQIVSVSDDGSVRAWDAKSRQQRLILKDPSPTAAKAVACTPAGAEANLCMAGMEDGRGYIWDLDSDNPKAIELEQKHSEAIRSAAFSPDGRYCVTGGEDRQIMLWDAATGKLRYRFPRGHLGPVTSLQFTPQSQLVSADRDKTLQLWSVNQQGAKLEKTFHSRSGGVTRLGVSADGKRVLFNQGKVLRVMSLPEGNTEGELQSVTGAADFSSFALFSPNGQLILTAGASESGLQLWRAPQAGRRGYEIRQLVSDQEPPTCAAFAPNGSFIVTGTRDRHLQIWPVPSDTEIKREIVAEAPRIDDLLESTKRQRKIWVELANPKARLTPGDTVTMVIYPLE